MHTHYNVVVWDGSDVLSADIPEAVRYLICLAIAVLYHKCCDVSVRLFVVNYSSLEGHWSLILGHFKGLSWALIGSLGVEQG